MKAIETVELSKTFKVKTKEKGLKGTLKSMVKPSYREINAVKDVSFDVNEGEVVAFIGPNGAGKSTTIKMITGILNSDCGEIRVLGLDPAKDRKKLAYNIGTVFGQKEQLWTHLTPYDNFKFFGAIYDLKAKDVEKKIEELSEKFELGEFINTPVRNLSLGQRIRSEIVASLIHNPKILFLDEPTIGLDPVVKDNIRDLIKKMNKEFNTTIFLTSHDISDIEKLCKRVIIINNGSLVMDSPMEELKHHYMNKKIIEVRFNKEMHISSNDDFKVLKQKNNNYKIEVDLTKKKTGEVLQQLGMDNIEDINILNVPLEDIITNIYKRTS